MYSLCLPALSLSKQFIHKLYNIYFPLLLLILLLFFLYPVSYLSPTPYFTLAPYFSPAPVPFLFPAPAPSMAKEIDSSFSVVSRYWRYQ